MIRKILKHLEYEWIFILALVYSGNYYIISESLLSLIVSVFFLIRILYLKNQWTLGIAILMLILTLIINLTVKNHLYQISQLPLRDYNDRVELIINPTDLNYEDHYFSGPAKGIISTNHGKKEINLLVRYYHQGDIQHNNQNHIQVWLTQGRFSQAEPNRNFFTFNYKKYLANQQIMWLYEIDNIHQKFVRDSSKDKLSFLKNKLINYFAKYNNQVWLALHNKIMLNINSSYYSEIKGNLQYMGILHFFAISGFHFAYIRKYLSYLLLRLGVIVEYHHVFLLSLLLLYLSITKYPIGLVRAFLMYYIGRIQRYYQLPISQTDIFAIVGLTVILLFPLTVTSIAFQLSFLMTYVILIYQYQHKNDELRWRDVELTIVCLVFSWPLLIQMNFSWNIVQLLFILITSLLFNKVIMPLVTMTTLLIFLPEVIWLPIIKPLNAIFEFIFSFDFNQHLGSFNIIIGALTAWEFVLLFISGVIFMILLNQRRKIAYIYIATIYSCLIFFKPYTNVSHRINLIDVGQGDATLIRKAFSQGTWLVDTGGKVSMKADTEWVIQEDYAYYNLIPALKALGVRRIDGLIISHMDIDHVGNIRALAKEIPIKSLYLSSFALQDSLWSELIESLGKIPAVIIEPGHSHQVNHSLKIYSLPEELINKSQSINNDSSLTVEYKLGDLSYLSTGDLSKEYELELIKYFPDIQANILKLGHHGSKTSTEERFLDYHQPILAVNSAGLNNRYGHPHLDVVEKLVYRQIPFISTHEVGGIEIQDHPLLGFQIRQVIFQD